MVGSVVAGRVVIVVVDIHAVEVVSGRVGISVVCLSVITTLVSGREIRG